MRDWGRRASIIIVNCRTCGKPFSASEKSRILYKASATFCSTYCTKRYRSAPKEKYKNRPKGSDRRNSIAQELIREKYKNTCKFCNKHQTKPKLIVYKMHGNDWVFENCILICRPCYNKNLNEKELAQNCA